MRLALAALIALIFSATAHALVNVSMYDDWSLVQGANNIVYSKTCYLSNFDCGNLTSNGTAWRNGTDNTINFVQGPYPFVGGQSNGPTAYAYATWMWTSNVTDVVQINGSVKAPAGANAQTIYVRKYDQLLGYIPIGNNSPMNFQFNVGVDVGTPISFVMYAPAGGVSFLFNTTIKSTTAAPASDRLTLLGVDEATSAVKLINVTISNSTNITNYAPPAGVWFNRSLAEIPTGQITVTFNNNTCLTNNVLPRSFAIDTRYSKLNFTAPLICDGSNAVRETFIIIDVTGQAIQNANVVIMRNGQNVSSTMTDGTGSAIFYLIAGAPYTIGVSKSGYNGSVLSLTGSESIITIPLSQNTGGGGYTPIINFDWSMTPENIAYPIFNVNTTSIAHYGYTLTYYSLNLTLLNGTGLYFVNYTNASGGPIVSNFIDRTEWNGTLYGILKVGQPGLPEWNYTRTFVVMNYTDSNSSVTWLAANLKTSDMTPSMRAVISLFGALVFAVAGFVAGTTGAGLMFVVAFAVIGNIVGFVEENLIYLLLLLVISIYLLNKNW